MMKRSLIINSREKLGMSIGYFYEVAMK